MAEILNINDNICRKYFCEYAERKYGLKIYIYKIADEVLPEIYKDGEIFGLSESDYSKFAKPFKTEKKPDTELHLRYRSQMKTKIRNIEMQIKRLADGLTYKQTGALYNISSGRVGYIHTELLRQLRHPSNAHIKPLDFDNKEDVLNSLRMYLEMMNMTPEQQLLQRRLLTHAD